MTGTTNNLIAQSEFMNRRFMAQFNQQ